MTKKIACDVSEPLGWITARENMRAISVNRSIGYERAKTIEIASQLSEPFEVTRPSLQSEPNLRNHCTAYEQATVYDDTNEPERANNEDDSTRDKRASSADHGTTPKRANKEHTMRIHDWNPEEGDALQGDVILFRIPDSINIDTSDEIAPRENRLIIAEGEVTGHHHAIWLRNPPVMFRDDGAGSGISADKVNAQLNRARKKIGTAKLYRDEEAVRKLVDRGDLTTDRLAIGILVVEGGPVCLVHDEHDAIRIPPGRYYVGGQQEWTAAEARRIAD